MAFSFICNMKIRSLWPLPYTACPRDPTCKDCVAVRVCRGMAPRTDARLARGGGHTLYIHTNAHENNHDLGWFVQTTGTHSTTVSPNRARSHGRKPAAHTRSRAGIGARKPAAAHTQPAGGRRRTDDGGAAVETTAESNLCADAPDGAPPSGYAKDALDTVVGRTITAAKEQPCRPGRSALGASAELRRSVWSSQ
jgi:hypothetical protein